MRKQLMRRCITTVLAVAVTLLAAPVVRAQKRGASTPQERAAIVEVALKLQETPLDRAVQDQRDSLLMVLVDAPDLQVATCADEMPWLKGKYKYTNDLMLVHLFSSVAYVIRVGQKDEKTAHLAGLQGAIKAYQAIVQRDPKARWQPMEDLVSKHNRGELAKRAPGFCKRG